VGNSFKDFVLTNAFGLTHRSRNVEPLELFSMPRKITHKAGMFSVRGIKISHIFGQVCYIPLKSDSSFFLL